MTTSACNNESSRKCPILPATRWAAALAALIALLASPGAAGSNPLLQAVEEAVSERTELADAARDRLRAAGPAGLSALFIVHRAGIDRLRAGTTPSPGDARLSAALDRVARQRDAHSAGLYWYTNLSDALASARSLSRPVLSLRLLGNLDEEYSCANSRFFRTALYANRAISALLRDKFVLHWQSVRPAPRATIDFGDGRVVERTLTGNSLHYVLTADGQVLDVLPGLYAPGAFQRELSLALTVGPLPTPAALAEHRRKTLARLDELARSSGVPSSTPDSTWNALALSGRPDAQLDEASVALMRRKAGTSISSASFARMLDGFERSMALDTVRNDLTFRREIHHWLLASAERDGLESLTRRIYGELFQTPDDDQWLGLVPPDTYSALDNDGRHGMITVTRPDAAGTPRPTADVAAGLAVTKMMVEAKPVKALLAGANTVQANGATPKGRRE